MRRNPGDVSKYRLRLKRLDFISVVDQPAQEPATCLLIKRAGDKHEIQAVARLAKIDEQLGLAFFWAFKSTDENGQPYHDLQGDQVLADDEMVKACADFMENGGLVDQQHDGVPGAGRVIFAMPMNPEIAKAFGVITKQSGLMIALKPKPDVMAKLKSGELTGVSMAGTGLREKIATARAGKKGYDADARSAVCKATWSTAMIDDLPDSSFLYIEPGGKKDADGKTAPRSLRYFPYKDENGKIDLDHLRDAIGRIPQSSLAPTLRNKLQVKAEKLLAAQHQKSARPIAKQAVLTSEDDGHQHIVDLDDATVLDDDDLRTSAAIDSNGRWHDHGWIFDHETGDITIAADDGHSHTLDAGLDVGTLAAALANNAIPHPADDDASDGVPVEVPAEASSGPAINVTISARAPAGISTRQGTPSNRGITPQESTKMADAKDTKIAELEKSLQDAKRLATLTDAQRAHHGKLQPDEAAAFLAKSHVEREAIVADIEKANEVVYTSKTTGEVYRKSDDPRLVAMAKRDDVREVELAKAKADREIEVLKARAKVELGYLAGDDDTKVALLKAVGADEKVAAILKAANEAMKLAGMPHGSSSDGDGAANTPLAKFNVELATFAKEKNKTAEAATEEFIHTKRGGQLYQDAENFRLSRLA